ncbi:hypothetical protein UB33_08070 [Photobacterium angustum]|uniref:hypothetical protein n=1 Tax=Photobacterium angustum TaxID=661 RepID=UPI0005E405BA|nr:hypothetical protein [Photobacterium angustum]KJG06524.1 hypothetical protein UB33_08070 [Photobacterium angustum]PSV91519.1 hypothetical protein CTN01_13230 [Photobacterium angustum]
MKTKIVLICSLFFASVIAFAGTINPFTITSQHEQQHKDYQSYSGDVVMQVNSGTVINFVGDSEHDEPNGMVYKGNVEASFPVSNMSKQTVLVSTDKLTVIQEHDHSIKLKADNLTVKYINKPAN